MNQRTISKLIRDSLDSVFDRLEPQDATTTEWTKAVKTELCEVGNFKGLYTCAKDVDKSKRNHGEWLYDVCWLKYVNNQFDFLKEAVLIAECEWEKAQGSIIDDFQKLLVGRARIRCMIWEDNQEQDESFIVDKLVRIIRTCSATAPDDLYLLARYTAGAFQYWHPPL